MGTATRTWVPSSDMVDEVEIRRAGPDDVEPVTATWWRSRSAAAPATPLPVHTIDEVRSWFAEVVLADREVWIAEPPSPPGARPTVAAILVLDGGHLDQLYVDPEWQGRSLGGRLVALAQRRRPDGLDLWTFQANHGARRFYERQGFVAVEQTDGDNEEGAPDVRYRWTASGRSR